MVEVQRGAFGGGAGPEPGRVRVQRLTGGVLGHPVQVQGGLPPAAAPVALDPDVQRQDVQRGARRGVLGGQVGEARRLREPAGRGPRVQELQHAVVRLAVVRVALDGLLQQPPRAGWQGRVRRRGPVLLPRLPAVQLGQGQQAHPRHRIRRGCAGGALAHVPGLDPQFVGSAVPFTVRPQGPLDGDPGPHHGGRHAVRFLGEPGPDHIGAGRSRGEDLGALRPLPPVRRALQQGPHRQPAAGAHLLERGPQCTVVARGVVGGECSVSGHQPLAPGRGSSGTARWSNNSPPRGGG
jgi:hypothetical protein